MATYKIKRFSTYQKLFMLYTHDANSMVKVKMPDGSIRAMSAELAAKKFPNQYAQTEKLTNLMGQQMGSNQMIANGGGYTLHNNGQINTSFNGGQTSSYGEKISGQGASNAIQNANKNNQQIIQQEQKRIADRSNATLNNRKAFEAGKNSVTLTDSLKKTASTTKGKLGLIGAGVATLGAGALLGNAFRGGK